MDVKKQKGSVLMELALVLPFMLASIFLMFAALSYATNQLSVNNAIADMFMKVTAEARLVSANSGLSDEDGNPLSQNFTYAQCSGGKIELKKERAGLDVVASIMAAIPKDDLTKPDGSEIVIDELEVVTTTAEDGSPLFVTYLYEVKVPLKFGYLDFGFLSENMFSIEQKVQVITDPSC